jgi:hypothetical protein
VHAPGWRVVAGRELPSVFPDRFRAKIDSALIIAAPTSTGGTYLAFSANRIDLKARALDIEPFGVIVHSGPLARIRSPRPVNANVRRHRKRCSRSKPRSAT